MDEDQLEQIRAIERERRIHQTARRYGLRPLARRMFVIVLTLFGISLIIIHPSDEIADYIRAFTLALGGYLILFALRIVQINWRIVRKTEGEMRMMPLHIQMIAISYCMFVIGAHGLVIELIGSPFEWYATPLVLPADVIGVFALGVMWRFQEVRRKAAGL